MFLSLNPNNHSSVFGLKRVRSSYQRFMNNLSGNKSYPTSKNLPVYEYDTMIVPTWEEGPLFLRN